ncbi:hypothetical protein WH47_06299 [Habropoda laboriosa]|uniref:Uncharacterized protein n=1 Tax=Habropoda laboriosa TaxID=597456 RepID=A0A0L7QS34_9HYME|nr:hypothetical protein WH47_06299 [Habropoda laboriosa]
MFVIELSESSRPCNKLLKVIALLRSKFSDRIISRNSAVNLPPRFCYLMLLHFFSESQSSSGRATTTNKENQGATSSHHAIEIEQFTSPNHIGWSFEPCLDGPKRANTTKLES